MNQYYWPDPAATAQILTDLAEFLAARGHAVSVLCSGGWYDKAAEESRPSREIHKCVEIIRLPAASLGRRSKVAQLVDFGSFHVLAAGFLLRHGGEFDVVVPLTTPPLIALPASLLAVHQPGVRVVHWCMNLHPDVEIDLGVLPAKGLAARVLSALTGWQLKQSDAVVSLGDCMTRRLVAKRVKPARIRRIPMWALHQAGEGGSDDFRREWGLEEKFVILHAGNAGAICTFEVVQQAALALKDDPRFVFLFTGGGRLIAGLEAFAKGNGLGNLRTAPYVPRAELGRLLRTGDVHLLSLRTELAGTSVPSKLYGIMAMGRPAVFIGARETESACAIARYGCGYTVDPGDVEGFVGHLRALVEDAELRRSVGAAGVMGYREEYNAEVCCRAWAELLESVSGGAHAGE